MRMAQQKVENILWVQPSKGEPRGVSQVVKKTTKTVICLYECNQVYYTII